MNPPSISGEPGGVMPGGGAEAPAQLPPVNHNSPLVVQQPADSAGAPADGNIGSDFIDTGDLYTALTRSQQIAGAGGMRRATSAPHSMDLYLMMYQQQQSTADPSGGASQLQRSSQLPDMRQQQQYLPPSGGAMRRVQSSLGMRRSSSFLWTPSAHHDFERAIGFLSARGSDVSPAAITQLMMARHVDLKVADVDKHMRKKFIVQRRVMQQLLSRDPLAAASANGNGMPSSVNDIPMNDASEPDSPPTGGLAGSRHSFHSLGMAAVDEEETAYTGTTLSEQLDRQRTAHRQLAVMHEQMQAGEEEC